MKDKPEDEIELKEMLLNNLTWLHLENAIAWAAKKGKKMDFDTLHEEIASSYLEHHVSSQSFDLLPFYHWLTRKSRSTGRRLRSICSPFK